MSLVSQRRARALGFAGLAIFGLTLPARSQATVRLATKPAASTVAKPAADPRGAEILWDTYGVPHIFAADDNRLGYAFGWAQMQGHANLILRLYGEARGRAAEYWGAEEEASDVWVRRMGISGGAKRWYAAQDPGFRRYLDAFADGINGWAASHRGEIEDSLEVVLPVSPLDILAHGQRVITASFVTNPERVEAYTGRWERNELKVSGSDDGSGARTSTGREPGDAAQVGSNAWAIAPKKSASGNAMLLANPHLPWSGLFTWFEAQLVAPGLDLYGATLVGAPVLAIGFNEQLAWTHTVNTHDGEDLYELTVDGDGYKWDGSSRRFETRTETLSVKQPDGRLVKKPLVLRASVHGPVVAEHGGKALALRVVGLDQPGMWKEWWDMGRARSLAAFRSALGQMQIPMFTVMYADRAGHIMHLFGGLTPVRSRGDWSYWQGIVRGDSSRTLWTKVHSLGDLPAAIDPPTGWLQNANDPPWTTTMPYTLDPATFPSYMAPRGMAFRPQRSAKLLNAAGPISFEEMVARKHSTRMELADRLLDDLVPAARERGNDLAKRAAGLLEVWDRSADAESRGGVLFQAWWREMGRGARGPVFATRWEAARPLETPDGLADPASAVSALERAAAEVEKSYRTLDVKWGDANRLRRDGIDLPANGGTGGLGIFRVTDYSEAPASDATSKSTGIGVASFGDSFVAAVEFSSPLKARALIGYGNWSQPGKHRTDQLGLYARKELRPVWRTRGDIEANLEKREVVGKRETATGKR